MLSFGLACAAAAMSLAACGSEPAPPAPEMLSGTDCADLASQGRQVTFGSEIGAQLHGVVLSPPAGTGSGATALVLAHMDGGDVCQWLPWGLEMAKQGYQVLAFDFAGFGKSTAQDVSRKDQVVAAAKSMYAGGATSIALVGASMGGNAVLAAAPEITPPVSAVLSLSPPVTYSGENAEGGAAKLTMPVMFVVGEVDPGAADAAKQLWALTPKQLVRRILIVPGDAGHGTFLVSPGTGKDVARADVLAFLKINAHT